MKPRFAAGAVAITALQYLGFSLIALLAIMGVERKKTQVSAPKAA